MKKYIQIVLVVLVFCGFMYVGNRFCINYTSNHIPMTQVEMISKSMQSVVAVYHPDYNTLASGFYIGNGVIVTAGHVAKEELKNVVFENGSEYDIIRKIKHPDYDCGFLIIEDCNAPALSFDTAEIQRGEIVFILGNPKGLTFNVSAGIISSISRFCNGYFGETILIGYDAVAVSGNSGSPVIDKDGEIRGVNVGDKGFHGSAVAITTKDILKALNEAGLEIN